jgi:hypothetical protein
MNIVIDLSAVQEQLGAFFSQPADVVLLRIFLMFGWIPIGWAFLWGMLQVWIDYIQGQWGAKQKFTLLAIDIPKNNEQSPKAVENLFTYFLGAHGSLNLIDKYWTGKYQLSFSFEIVSIEGYTQFLVHTPESFKDLVESAVYSQYPDAEITEVNDYTEGAPTIFPDDEKDVWGAEFILVKPSAYPIKTYRAFEHVLGDPKLTYRDPISSLMSLCSSLGPGEQFWYQIICKPIDFSWISEGDKEIKKLMNETVAEKRGIFEVIVDGILGFFNVIIDMALGALSGSEAVADKVADPFKFMNLKPREKKQLESIQEKISKAGFECKVRMVYLADKDVMNKPKVVNGFVGYMKQYADLDLNNLKPDTKVTATTVNYFFVSSRLNERKRKIVSRYKNRSGWGGRMPFVLNIEELASLWHFPIEGVTAAPMLVKTPGRKAVPPATLPIGEQSPQELPEYDDIFVMADKDKKSARIPESIFVEDSRDEKRKPEAQPVMEEDIFAPIREELKSGKKNEGQKGLPPRGTPPSNLPFG